jgi:hypothetical protein
LERGDHIIISLKAHSKFHMYVFDETKRVKKENKVWGQKHKQLDAIPKKKKYHLWPLINLMFSK